MRLENVPMLVRRFDANDPEDTDLITIPGVPLPYGMDAVFVNSEKAKFEYGNAELSPAIVRRWINVEPHFAFWVFVSGDVRVEHYGSDSEGEHVIDAPLKFHYVLNADCIILEDRETLSEKPLRGDVVRLPTIPDSPLYQPAVGVHFVNLFTSQLYVEAARIVLTILKEQPEFSELDIVNEGVGEDVAALLRGKDLENSALVGDIQLTDTVRDKLAQDLKRREALPLSLPSERIAEWRTLHDVIDDVDWHMHIR